MPSTNSKQRSLLKRLSFRPPFARKQQRSDSPVSVLDDEVLLLPKTPGNDPKEFDLKTISSSKLQEEEINEVKEGGVCLMDDLNAEAPALPSNEGASKDENERCIKMEARAPVVQENYEAISVEAVTKESSTVKGVVEGVTDSRKDVSIVSMSRSSSHMPWGDESRNALEAGARVHVHGGTYKNSYGMIVKVMKVKVEVAIDGEGTKRIDKKNVAVVHQEDAVSGSEMESLTSPLINSLSETSDGTRLSSSISSDNPTTLFSVGQIVLITKGDHKDKQGKITKVTNKMVEMTVFGVAKSVKKRKTSVQQIFSEEKSPDMESEDVTTYTRLQLNDQIIVQESASHKSHQVDFQPTVSFNDTCPQETDDCVVSITAGKYKNKSGRVEHVTEKMVKVYIESIGKSVRVKRSSTTIGYGTTAGEPTASLIDALDYSAGDEWHLPDSGMGGTRFGSRIIMKLRTQHYGAKRSEQNFLTHLFQDRLQVTETPMNKKEMEHPFDVNIAGEGGFGYELISMKVQKDGDASGGRYYQGKCIRLVYVQVTGPQRTSYSLKQELERLGDFASLSTRKVVSRLELLQSPAYRFKETKESGMFSLKNSDFVLFTHESNDGCGFISEDLLVKLCSKGSKVFAKQALALQIRAVIPRLGIFKGVLFRKHIPPGQPQIQLMPSMQKVGPSREADTDERAFLWITQQGMHPTQNNVMIGRLLDSSQKPPPKSFKPKKISDEIVRSWQTLKVPKHVCDTYVKNSTRARALQHASVVGVADPTSSLPAGHVFVTGMKHLPQESLFVTRFPCNLPHDGRILQNVTQKPDDMSEENWVWLNKLPFGAIIFPDAEEGMKPLPEMVADGDLDGDLYFVCWNQNILQNIEAEPIQGTSADKEPSSQEEPQPDDNWLEKAQRQMIDAGKVYEINELVGKLYNLSKTAAIKNEELIMADPKAMAFAAAFKRALQHGKHGGAIPLDPGLHAEVPPRLHKYLTSQ